jgi:signal transduction histidine kinase
MQEAASLLDEVTNEVRNIAHEMDSGVLARFGLAAAIEDLCHQLSRSGMVTIRFREGAKVADIDEEIELCLYRCARELLTNALKHADASHIEVELNCHNQHLNLIIADNGKGFNYNEVVQGLGLQSINSRLNSINAVLTIDSHVKSGTSAIIDLPMNVL